MIYKLEKAIQHCIFCNKEIDIRLVICKECVQKQYQQTPYTDDNDFDVVNIVFDPLE